MIDASQVSVAVVMEAHGMEVARWETAGERPELIRLHDPEARMPLPSDLSDFARQFESRRLTGDEARRYGETTSLRQLHADVSGPDPRFDRIGRKAIRSDETEAKDLQAISLFERFSPRPASAGAEWAGLPIGLITSQYLDRTWQAAVEAGRSPAYVSGCRQHVQVILRHAQRVGAINQVPEPRPIVIPASRTQILRLDDDWGQVTSIYRDLPPLLQLAFVLGLFCGMRAEDLFSLRWSQFRPEGDPSHGITFPVFDITARKVTKLQGIPLAPQVVAELERHRKDLLITDADAYIFAPRWANPEAQQPGKTKPARARNAKVKEVFARHAAACEKPWQVLRATANERYERHQDGLGAWVLGHAASGVNQRHYRCPDEAIYRSVCETPGPIFNQQPANGDGDR